MDTYVLLQRLYQIAKLLEFQGANPFRISAYNKAARNLKQISDLEELITSGSLTSVEGIGSGLAAEITAIAKTGTSPLWEQLRSELPVEGLLEILSVPGLGPKSAQTIYTELRVSTLGQLEYACQENRLVELPGFGAKKQAKLLQEIDRLKQYRHQIRYGDAVAIAQQLLSDAAGTGTIVQASATGKLRRCWEVLEKLEFVVEAPPEAIAAWLSDLSQQPVKLEGEALSTAIAPALTCQFAGVPITCYPATAETYGWLLLLTTGSLEHLHQLEIPTRPNWAAPGWSEAQLYEALELAWIPPELREGTGEIEAGRSGTLPTLVRRADLKGVLHLHTTYSDGANTLEEMVQAALTQGYEYLGVSDHSQAAYYARGLKPEDVRRQHQEIERLNQTYGGQIRILKGIEADILPDGSLDYDAEDPGILQSFDFVVASVHSQLKMSPEAMTARLIKAVCHPCVTMLGHWTGRILLGRESSQFDHAAVMAAAAAHNVAIEFNASPYRLDVDWREIRQATDLGLKIAVNPDAHSTSGLECTALTLPVARKGWLEPKNTLNALTVDELIATKSAK